MAKTIREIKHEVLLCNTIFASNGGTPQSVACRVRGDKAESNAKTIKIPAWMFGAALPLPGEAVYVSEGSLEEDTASNYRTLRNGKVSIEVAHEAAPTAHPAAPPEVEEIPAF